jgi:hypothetical protein
MRCCALRWRTKAAPGVSVVVTALREVLEPAIRSPGALQHQVRAREEMNIRSVIDGMRTQGSQDFSRHSVSHLPVHETDSWFGPR